MIKTLLKLYMIGFAFVIFAALFLLPNTSLFLLACYLILFVMGMVIIYMESTIGKFIYELIICLGIGSFALYGIYKTKSFEESSVLLMLIVPILISTYHILKEDVTNKE
ncbi:MAG: hypothetical protein RR863_05580 [Erysipelotrichaceae bacterium]